MLAVWSSSKVQKTVHEKQFWNVCSSSILKWNFFLAPFIFPLLIKFFSSENIADQPLNLIFSCFWLSVPHYERVINTSLPRFIFHVPSIFGGRVTFLGAFRPHLSNNNAQTEEVIHQFLWNTLFGKAPLIGQISIRNQFKMLVYHYLLKFL